MPIMNGIEAAREIRRVSPATKSILVAIHSQDQYVLEALKAGIKGYVLKSQSAEDLVQAIKEVSQGGLYFSPGISPAIVDAYLRRTESPPPYSTEVTLKSRGFCS